ncbi:phospholipase A I [Strongylocentrotus purpuratus]|uniref:PNPLA domain-containing protein n=1 Tax=Strongylocentrotus purpuratus TaxID=7668 RepID=A0A7M7HK98_STRPU|nr:phospholipase A I [Strongylocentrotus purpuratus]XP_782958.1 phospholipase A I [Strongylocentrotus purpuratus]|eukprot:XP_011683797.1 PREDICTED: phospholipase A I [Strongylocentrotus purpuratus]
MDIQKPVLMGRLIIWRQLENNNWHRRKLHKCCKAKYRSGKAAMLTSAAYLNIASGSSLQHGHKQFTYISARFKSSKSQKGNTRKENAMSLASLYHAAGSVSNSVQRKIVDGVFTPVLLYSYQMLPKLSARDHKVLSEKRDDQENQNLPLQNEKIEVNQVPNRGDIEHHTKPQIATPASVEERLDERKPVEFQIPDLEKKGATYWVEFPSLKKYASVSALTEMGLSATRVLHRKRFGDAVASGNQHANNKPMPESQLDSEHYQSESHPSNSSECITDTKDPKQLNLDIARSTSKMQENVPPAAEFVPEIPPLSSSNAYNIFKKLGFTSSSSAAVSSPSNDRDLEKDKATSKITTSNNLENPHTSVEYKTDSYTTQSASSSSVQSVETDETAKQQQGNASYIYNNYNLKYIQINLFSSPNWLLSSWRKEKPVVPLSASDENTAYFDSDIPLLEMTDALNSKDASGVPGDSKSYAAVADKIKEESAKLKAAEADKSARKTVRPVISKANVDARTKSLALGINTATSNASRLVKLERLCDHLVQFPESRQAAIQERLIPTLLKHKQKIKDTDILAQVHQLLAQLGYASPVKNRGVRILSVDGGGSRGIIAIEILRELERQSGKPVHEMFDYIIGVSSGAVLVYLLAYAKASLDVCEQLFKEMSVEVFNRNTLLGTSKLFFSHAFYDTDAWMKILRSHMQGVGQSPAIEMSQDPNCPKVAALATLMNAGPIKNYLFRNYNPPPNTTSFYQGSSKYQLCEGLRASSAAPGYFEEYKLDDHVFQDGGVLTNNPSALGLHESKLLWPDTPIQCVVSLGTGRYDPMEEGLELPEYSSLKKKLYQIMISATDTESVHTTLQDLLPAGSYFRFNTLMSEDFLLDENRPDKLDQLQQEALDFVSINELRIMQAAGVLTREKSSLQKATDWVKLQKDIYR